ncbi:MAG: TerB family tellurite resistance protein [Bacteroidetes bacterium]|nr:MAG: TerB family tellurite resistance protein [Bacteroidota bacterium]
MQILQILLIAVVIASFVDVYLTLNKIWKRKHLKIVADSISISGRLIAITSNSLMLTTFLLHLQWESVSQRTIFIILGVFQIFVGIGLWVDTQKHKGFWKLLKQSLIAEKKESAKLALSLFKPNNAEAVLEILIQVAMLDGVLEEREKEFIQSFANNWNIQISWTELTQKMGSGNYNFEHLHTEMEKYLASSPPPDQVSQLGDLLNMLVGIDEDISVQEELMLAELTAQISRYLNADLQQPLYHSVIIPQNLDQDQQLKSILAEQAKKDHVAGGEAYVMGPFYSEKYTETMCKKYRDQGYLSLWLATLPNGNGNEK